MFVPELFNNYMFDDFFGEPITRTKNAMKTDIKEKDDGYEFTVDLPGIKKEDVTAELNNGYLTINATSTKNNDEKDKKGNYIRRERYTGSYSRSFYVGDSVKEEDIKAKFENGVLKLDIPKKPDKPEVEQKKYIAIEG